MLQTPCQTSAVDTMMDVERDSGTARRRRECRLRSWQKHERQTVRMLLAETFHFSSARSRRRDAVWVTRPASSAEPPGPQERVQRLTVEQIFDFAPMVPILEVPVPPVVLGGVQDRISQRDRGAGFRGRHGAGDRSTHDFKPCPTSSSSCCSCCAAKLVDVPVPSFHECSVVQVKQKRVLPDSWVRAARVVPDLRAEGGLLVKSGTLHTHWDLPWDPDGAAAAVHRKRLGMSQ